MTTTEISDEELSKLIDYAGRGYGVDGPETYAALTELRDRRAAGGSPEIAASMMRVTAIVEGLYGFLDMGAYSSEELKANWNRWVEEKQKLWELSQICLHPSPDTGKSLQFAVSRERLMEQIASDPDGEVEAGTLHPERAQPVQEMHELEDVSNEQVLNVAHRIQAILADKLTVDEGEIVGVGPASYKIARLFKPAQETPKSMHVEGDVHREAKVRSAIATYIQQMNAAHAAGEEGAGYVESGSYFSTLTNLPDFVVAALRGGPDGE